MIKEAIDKILELRKVNLCTINDREYTDKEIYPVKEPLPSCINVGTLEALLVYLSECDKGLRSRLTRLDTLFIIVVNPTTVQVKTGVTEEFFARGVLIQSDAELPKVVLNTYIPVEPFIIMLKTVFVQSPAVQDVVKIVGNVKAGTEIQQEDDGITQRVTTKAGAARVEEVEIPNPIMMAPYRTFMDIAQPESPFLLRMRAGGHGIEAALFEADGGMWRQAAMRDIKDYFTLNLTEKIPVLN